MSYYYVNLIKQQFQFLIHTYGFVIIKESYNPESIIGNGTVIYQSKSVNIEITVDRTAVLLNIGQRNSPGEKWSDFQDVMQFFAPEINDVYLHSGVTLPLNDLLAVESRLRNTRLLLRQYCEPLIKGDFSMLPEIKEAEAKRTKRNLYWSG